MAISGSLQSNKFFYFPIFTTYGVPVITLLLFSLGNISSYNKDVPIHSGRTNISTVGIQRVCLASTRTTVEYYGIQSRAGWETYSKLLYLSNTRELIGYTTSLSVPMKFDRAGFSLDPRNLVQLVGWCHERELELLVVYELMENQSLDVYLFNSEIAPLAWDLRYKIAHGLAKALRYHEECGQHCVLHMDIKLSNVLLDSNFEPKLSDFGLARLIDHDRSMEPLDDYVREKILLFDRAGFSLDPNSSAVHVNTMWITNNSSQVSVMGEKCRVYEVVVSYSFPPPKLKKRNGSNTNLVHDTFGQPRGKNKRKFLRITVFSLCVVLIVFLFLFVLFIFLHMNKKPTHENDETAGERSTETFELCSPRPFTFEELTQATNNFHQEWILGVGGFGAVYKAILPNGKTVAVKRVSNTSQQGIKEYKAEVTIISRSNHRNLVQLVGWCHEREGELLVVYELMENRSLDVYLFNSEIAPLAWDMRYKIAHGLAKALRYLHEECGQHCVLHLDIKSSNVLLDSNFEPKLSDFGLARLIDHDRSMEVSVLAGTRGYLAPECVLTGKVRKQSDVYSYGVVALELATGRKTIDPNVKEDQKVLVKWVQSLYRTDRILEAVDPRLGDDYDELQMKGLIVVGLWCVLHDFRKRPSMKEIVRVLDSTQDPLSDLHQRIPSLFHDSVPYDFDSILETYSTTSDLMISLEMEKPSPIEFVGDMTTLPEPEYRYSPVFVWQHISLLRLLRYLIGVTWFRSSNHG